MLEVNEAGGNQSRVSGAAGRRFSTRLRQIVKLENFIVLLNYILAHLFIHYLYL